MQRNVELEWIDLFQKFSCTDEILYLACLNRGGRKLFMTAPYQVPIALWPHLLERTNKKKMAKGTVENDIKAKADAIYHVLRGPALFDGRRCSI
jgi:hypothetical protein